MVIPRISRVIDVARSMKIVGRESGRYHIVIICCLVIFGFSANVPFGAGESDHFTDAIEKIKQAVVPVVCFGENPDTKAPYLISVEGTGFFVIGDRRVITAGHVAKGILAKERIPACPIPAIYIPTDGWNNSSIRYVPIKSCTTGDALDIGACELGEDPLTDDAIKVKPQPVALDETVYPDGTPIAFTGFPLSFVEPITSQGIIGTYRGLTANLGPTELVIDKSAWPGASGSPVFGEKANVVGILTQRGFNDASGLAFAIPGHAVKKFLTDNPAAKSENKKDHPEGQEH